MSDKLASGIKAGSTSVSLPVELLKSADSTALTGKVYTDVTASYWRQGGTRTAITTATLGSVNASYSSGGFVEVDATNMPGVYRFDVPDAAFATGADWVVISLKVSTAFQLNFMFALESVGAAELSARIPAALASNGEMKADVLRVAGTSQTARDLGASVLLSVGTGSGQVNLTSGKVPATIAAGDLDTDSITAASVKADAVTKIQNGLSTYAGADTAGTTTLLARLTAIRAGLIDNLDAAISAVKANTDNIPGDPADASDIAALFSSVNTSLTTIAGYLDTEVAAIKAKTDNLPASPAASSDVPSAAVVASAVRTELATELGRIDVAVSSVSGGEGGGPSAADIRAEIDANSTVLAAITAELVTLENMVDDTKTVADAVKAKTDNLPAVPAATGDAMTLTAAYDSAKTSAQAATALSNVQWTNARAAKLDNLDAAVSSISGGGSGPTALEIAEAVVDQTLSGHNTAGTVGGALVAAGNSGDPWSATDLDQYADDTAGKILSKLNIGAPDEPIVVIPGAPADLSLCRVYGYLETIANQPAANVDVHFELLAADPIKSERFISGRKVTARTNAEGQLTFGGNAYLDLQRNDQLTPAGSKYRIVSKALNLDQEVELNTDTYDLADLIP